MQMLVYYDCDLILLCETWLLQKSVIPKVPGYCFLTKHRSEISKRAKVGSGGVAILIHNRLLNEYHIEEIIDTFENILAVKLKHKSIAVVCGYLPPDFTKHGNDPDKFLNLLHN